MRGLTLHQQLAQELESSRAQVLAAIDGLSDEEASRPAADGWSVKDHLTHIMLWHEMRFFEISRIARGGRASFPVTNEAGVEGINGWFVAGRRALTLDQVIADLEFARAMVLEAVANAPEDRLDQRLYEEIGIQGGAAHDREHAGLIIAWRQKEGL
ncbi:MAG: DinB family protein [Dehalococcoidia bacterium]